MYGVVFYDWHAVSSGAQIPQLESKSEQGQEPKHTIFVA